MGADHSGGADQDYAWPSGDVATDVTLNEDKPEMKSSGIRGAETPGQKTPRAADRGALLFYAERRPAWSRAQSHAEKS